MQPCQLSQKLNILNSKIETEVQSSALLCIPLNLHGALTHAVEAILITPFTYFVTFCKKK